jgi:hypothetical protein
VTQGRALRATLENAAGGIHRHRPGAANNIANHRFDLTALQWDLKELDQLDVEPEPKPLDLSQMSVAKGLAYVTAFVETVPIARPASPRRAT